MKDTASPLDHLRELHRAYLKHRAGKRLQIIVDETRDSYECRRFREHRAAALKGLGR